MSEPDFDSIRDEIQQSAEWLRHKKGAKDYIDFNRLFGATDTLLESSLAASAYEETYSQDTGAQVLIAYGFLQSLFVMQDAVRQLHWAVFKKDCKVWENKDLSEIRSARNRIAGHPSRADREKSDGLGISSAFFPFFMLLKTSFLAQLYLQKGSVEIFVNVPDWRRRNKSELAKLMLPIRDEIVRLERDLSRPSTET